MAPCSDTNCTAATVTVVDDTVFATHTSIVIGVDGLGLISYYDSNNADLNVAHCSNRFCIPYVWVR